MRSYLFQFIGYRTLFWWAGLSMFDKPCNQNVQEVVSKQECGFGIKEFYISHSLMALNFK